MTSDTTHGGLTTARVPAPVTAAEAQRRADERAAAARYITRVRADDAAELLAILGLADPEPARDVRAEDRQSPLTGRRRPRDRGGVREDLLAELLAGHRPAVTTTPAEIDAAIGVLVGRGWSSRQVAEWLGVTPSRVRHRIAALRAGGEG